MNREELPEIEAAVVADLKGLITYLERIAGHEKVGPGEGPVRMGSFSDLSNAKWISVCAAQYLASVGSGIRRFPYFDRPKARSRRRCRRWLAQSGSLAGQSEQVLR